MGQPSKVKSALVVEDSATQAMQLQFILESAGIQVDLAESGELAIEMFGKKRYNIVLTDINMPGMSGYELCAKLRKNRRNVPVVLLTNLTKPSDIVRGLECGAANFIAKPYSKEHLLKRVDHILRNHNLRETGKITGGVPILVQSEDSEINVSSAQVMDFLLSTFEDYARATEAEMEARQQEKERGLEAENYRVREELVRKEMEAQKEREIAILLEESNQALAEREARMRVMVDTAPDGIFTVGPDGVIESASEKMHRMFGYSTGELPGKKIFDLLPNFFEASFLNDQLSTWQGKIFGPGRDLEGRRKDGSIIPIELALSLLNLTNKQIITGIARDITDRKRADERLKIQYSITKVLAESSRISEAAAKILSLLSENSNWTALGLWLLKEEQMSLHTAQIGGDCENIEKLKLAMEEQNIIKDQGFLGKVWAKNAAKATSLKVLKRPADFVAQVAGTNVVSAVAFPVRGNNGQLLGLIEIFTCKDYDADAEMLSTLDLLGTQIGQFVERVSAERRLLESEHLLIQLAENVPEVFWIASPTFQTLYYASPAYETVWGRKVQDLYEDAPSFLAYVVEQDRVKVQEHVKAVRKSPHGHDIEYDITRPNGDIRHIFARTTAIFDENGKVTRICGIARDVTEKKEAERRVSEFYSTVSHELRTPLTSIRGSLGLIEGGLTGPLQEKTLQFIKIARAESDRLIRLINEILDIRKIEAGKLELKLRPVYARELAANVCDGLKGMASDAGVYLENNVQTDVKLYCDRDRITQVLTNLVSNAIKFSGHGQTVNLKFSPSQPSTYRFSVVDRGPGISAAEQNKLFGLFQQLDASDSRKKGGTGLGLAISKALVEMHGGTIGLDSRVGDGSTFWFELAEAAEIDRIQAISDTHERVAEISTAPSGKRECKFKVLVVEDDLSTQELILHQLKTLGLDCMVAADGEAAIEMTHSKHPDLIVLDVGVPKSDGFQVIQHLRSGSACSTPLVIYTSRDLDEKDRELLTLGPTRHLIKSKTSERGLVDAVRELLPSGE